MRANAEEMSLVAAGSISESQLGKSESEMAKDGVSQGSKLDKSVSLLAVKRSDSH